MNILVPESSPIDDIVVPIDDDIETAEDGGLGLYEVSGFETCNSLLRHFYAILKFPFRYDKLLSVGFEIPFLHCCLRLFSPNIFKL